MSNQLNKIQKHIQQARNDLKGNKTIHAEEQLKQAMLIDFDSAVIHNLYGILMELLHQDQSARKHFLAATIFDPTYKPAMRNLERIATYHFFTQKNDIDYGDRIENEAEDSYALIYDDKHVGHLIKKEMER